MAGWKLSNDIPILIQKIGGENLRLGNQETWLFWAVAWTELIEGLFVFFLHVHSLVKDQ